VGGSLQRHEGSIIGGKGVTTGGKITEREDEVASNVTIQEGGGKPIGGKAKLRHAAHDAGSAITRAAMLFVFGVVVLSLLRPRYENVKMEIVSRPVRSFALGLVALVIGIAATAVLSITVIGIPLAIIGVLLSVLCVYGGIVSVLTVAGELLLRHRTENPYVHLAAGSFAFLILGAIPVVGGLVTFLVVFIAIGSVVATKAGGLFSRA
jgi:hypothetical protein